MNSVLILKSDIIDIVFEKRNKDYGAYNLRKFYCNRLFKSMAITLSSALLLCAFVLFSGGKKKVQDEIPVVEYGYAPPNKKEEKKAEKPPMKKTTSKPKSTQAWINNLKIVKDTMQATKLANDISNISIASTTSGTGLPDYGTGLDTQLGTGGNISSMVDSAAAKSTDSRPLEQPDVMPSYPGGMSALAHFLQKNLTNPREMEQGEEVSVKIQFVVDYNGKLQSFVTVKDGGDEFNKEVIRVLKKMPNWLPGKNNGKNVPVYYVIPVKFVGE